MSLHRFGYIDDNPVSYNDFYGYFLDDIFDGVVDELAFLIGHGIKTAITNNFPYYAYDSYV